MFRVRQVDAYSNARVKSYVRIYVCGGGIIGVSEYFLQHFRWQSLFYRTGCVCVACGVLRSIPCSLDV